MRVLAFEDGWDIAELLERDGVDVSALEIMQHWDSQDFLERIRDFVPDVLLLDHFIPPTKGLEVLRQLNAAVSAGEAERPELVVGMSSASMANTRMLNEGADHGILKYSLATLDFWPRRQD